MPMFPKQGSKIKGKDGGQVRVGKAFPGRLLSEACSSLKFRAPEPARSQDEVRQPPSQKAGVSLDGALGSGSGSGAPAELGPR
jgi:hypothetical protein